MTTCDCIRTWNDAVGKVNGREACCRPAWKALLFDCMRVTRGPIQGAGEYLEFANGCSARLDPDKHFKHTPEGRLR